MSTYDQEAAKALQSMRTCNNPKALDVSSEDFCQALRAIYVGSSGDLVIDAPNGERITYVGLASGVWHPIAAGKIISEGTTAGNLVGELDEPLC